MMFPISKWSEREESWTFEIVVAPDNPYFAGHFEKEPILPAIAQLELVRQLLAEATGTVSEIRRAPRLRFRDRVVPGEVLEATVWRPDPVGRSRFEIRGKGRVVSEGSLVWEERA